MVKLTIPYYEQEQVYTCGPAALQMAFAYFAIVRTQRSLARQARTSRITGTTNTQMAKVARAAGFTADVEVRATLTDIKRALRRWLPVIVNYINPDDEEGHYAVVSGIGLRHVILHDPWNGEKFRITKSEFLRRWHDESGKHQRWMMVLALPGHEPERDEPVGWHGPLTRIIRPRRGSKPRPHAKE